MYKISKFLCIAVLSFLFLSKASFADESFFGIGAELFKDKYNKKTLITRIIPNSPAQALGLVEGDEIVSVDGIRTRKFELFEIVSKIRGDEGTSVKLVIKKNFFVRKTVTLTRALINPEEEPCDAKFNRNWAQVTSAEYGWYKPFPKEVIKKLSWRFKRNDLVKINYWIERKNAFRAGYDECGCSCSDNSTCLNELLKREIMKTTSDMQIYKSIRERK